MDSKIYRRSQELIRKECCNFDSAGNCVGIGKKCQMFLNQTDECGLPIYKICSWFKNNVLPYDDKLQHDFLSSINENIDSKICILCGQPFIPKDGRQTMCLKCKTMDSRVKNAMRRRGKSGK